MSDIAPNAASFTQLNEWGYPQGRTRRIKPTILGVVHITGNSRLPSAASEIGWRRNDPANQNSATAFCDRDGTLRQALLPSTQAAWANGDVNRADATNPLIAAALRTVYNFNEWVDSAIENVGFEDGISPDYPITAAQEDANAAFFAWRSRVTGIPANRTTIIGHYQINGVSRTNCPGRDKRVIDRIVAKTQALLGQAPSTPPEDDVPIAPPVTIVEKLPGASVTLEAGRTYNAFQYLGPDAAGKPVLRRLNDLVYTKTSSADVIYRASFDAGDTDGWLISPWAYLPKFGYTAHVWWSKSPNPEPVLVRPQVPSADCSVQEATIKNQTAIIADQKTQLAAVAPRIAAKDAALDAVAAHEAPHVAIATKAAQARAV